MSRLGRLEYGHVEGTGPLAGMSGEEASAKIRADTEEFLARGGEVRTIPYLTTTYEYNYNVLQALRVQKYGDRWGDYKMGDIVAGLEGRAAEHIAKEREMMANGD